MLEFVTRVDILAAPIGKPGYSDSGKSSKDNLRRCGYRWLGAVKIAIVARP